jgi:glutamate-ammonia-ligase adenylyltransferase
MDQLAALVESTFARRIAAAPRLFAEDEARARVEDWLEEIAGTPAGRTLKQLVADHPMLNSLLAGIAEGSPYLWELARADPARLTVLLESDPGRRFEAILADAARAIAATDDDAEVMRLLRRMKAEAALLIALADIGAVWPVMRVTSALTELADAAVDAAVRHLLDGAARRGRLIARDRDRPGPGSGYIVLAMGKMGARELNYSSDIDLIVFYEAAAAALTPGIEPGPFYVRLTRALVKLLQERTADGYVFRTDLRLRPDPASTQIAVSTAAALDYYESVGQNWERAALIKARACAGDIAAGEALLTALAPFIWRKYLDFAAVGDIHSMKRQIHAYRGHGEIAVEGHNVKLGRGGICEIEFFIQTQQLVAGGRHPELRLRETPVALTALAEARLDRRRGARPVGGGYRFCVPVEHAAQMVADEQTHTLPGDRATSLNVLRASSALPTATHSPKFCSRICATCSATTRRCSRTRPPPRPSTRPWFSPPTPTTATPSTSSLA